MEKFIVGKTYNCRSICDHNCVWNFTVISRTEKKITLQDEDGKVFVKGIQQKASVHFNCETCEPLGHYSMCPSLWANNIRKDH